jgi:hypothetical protein
MAILKQIAISINAVTMTKNTKSAHGKPERWTEGGYNFARPARGTAKAGI